MNTLKLKLKRIDPVKYGLIVGVTIVLILVVLLILGIILSSLIGSAFGNLLGGAGLALGGGIFALLFIIPLYFGIGFVFGWLGTVILNFILKKTGGLEMEFEKDGFDLEQIGTN